MKKEPFALLVAFCSLFVSLAAFSACGDEASGNTNTNSLTFDKRYLYYESSKDLSQPAEKQTYFIFHSDKTGEYRYYKEVSHRAYTIKFKYITILNESAVCFYDSVEYEETHTDTYEASTTWTQELLYSPEFIVDSYGNTWICETYLEEELPNFGK